MYGEAEEGGCLAPGQSHWGEIRALVGGGVLSPKEEGEGETGTSLPYSQKDPTGEKPGTIGMRSGYQAPVRQALGTQRHSCPPATLSTDTPTSLDRVTTRARHGPSLHSGRPLPKMTLPLGNAPPYFPKEVTSPGPSKKSGVGRNGWGVWRHYPLSRWLPPFPLAITETSLGCPLLPLPSPMHLGSEI